MAYNLLSPRHHLWNSYRLILPQNRLKFHEHHPYCWYIVTNLERHTSRNQKRLVEIKINRHQNAVYIIWILHSISIYKFFEEPFVWSENATWPGDEWSINVFSGVKKMTNILWVRYDSILTKPLEGARLVKWFWKSSLVAEMSWNLTVFFFFFFFLGGGGGGGGGCCCCCCCCCFVTWCDIFYKRV